MMDSPIERQPDDCARSRFDLIVVGGGIYGVMLALHAASRGLQPLVLERSDYGCETSFNSLRIIHGGLRYLQSLDLRRFRESVRERQWFLKTFPDLVRPLACLMPLYGHGLRNNLVMRTALFINDILSASRNEGLPEGDRIAGGVVVGRREAQTLFPGDGPGGIRGAAIWHDATMLESQRIVMESLRWAVAEGARALNYMEVTEVIRSADAVVGVKAKDAFTSDAFEFRAPTIINAAGPWCDDVVGTSGCARGQMFWPSLAWNVLTDVPAPSKYALAITPARKRARTYFLHPWKGRLLIGTGHDVWTGGLDRPMPAISQVREMIDDVASVLPAIGLTLDNVDRVFAGLLPATGPCQGKIATKPVILDHALAGGPRGLVSICGVKFTTARHVAQVTLDRVYGRRAGRELAGDLGSRPEAARGWDFGHVHAQKEIDVESSMNAIGRIIANESPMTLSDVVFRRTNLWEKRAVAQALASRICDLFGWPEPRRAAELKCLAEQTSFGAGLNVNREVEAGSLPKGSAVPVLNGPRER